MRMEGWVVLGDDDQSKDEEEMMVDSEAGNEVGNIDDEVDIVVGFSRTRQFGPMSVILIIPIRQLELQFILSMPFQVTMIDVDSPREPTRCVQIYRYSLHMYTVPF